MLKFTGFEFFFENPVTIQAHEKGTPRKAAFKPWKIFLEFFLNVEV
jgi:hypothetical protein